jgi:undecaprenyl-diphosphatase
MQYSDSELRNNKAIYSYGIEKQKKIRAYYLLVSGITIFLLTLTGLTNGISEWTNNFLLEKLGYTNKWSATFGPRSFVLVMSDIAALSSKVVILIAVIIITIYYRMYNMLRQVWKFLIVIFGGISFLILVKLLFTTEIPYDPIELFTSNIGSYPSGHAFMAMIFYLTVALMLSRKQKRADVRRFIFISASSIIFLIGISRILGAAHNVSEVLAGWSLGLVWVCTCWLVERFIKINFKLKLD